MYTCSTCGKEYPVAPKHCACTSMPLPEAEIKCALVGPSEEVILSAEKFEELKSVASLQKEKTSYYFRRIVYESMVDQVAEAHEEYYYLTEQEYKRILALLYQ